MELLNIKDLSITYVPKGREVYAVKNVDLKIDKGDSVGIVGESGSGKSTLAMGILRLLPGTAKVDGEIEFNDKDLLKLSKEEFRKLRWKSISVVFQKSMNSLSPVHRIGDQFKDIYRVHKPEATSKEIKDKVIKLFKLVNLRESVFNLYPHELSGGMMQRVSIVLSLIFEPELLIMDESTTALDVVTQGQILDEIIKMEEEMNVTRIMITHDLSVVATSCKKAVILYAGEMMENGDTKTIIENPRHPYTKGLLESIPDTSSSEKKMRGIKGFLPDLSKKYDGCIFCDRCPKRMEICSIRKPELRTFPDGVNVYCHLYNEHNPEGK